MATWNLESVGTKGLGGGGGYLCARAARYTQFFPENSDAPVSLLLVSRGGPAVTCSTLLLNTLCHTSAHGADARTRRRRALVKEKKNGERDRLAKGGVFSDPLMDSCYGQV